MITHGFRRYNDADSTIASVLGGNYNLTKTGSGTLTLTASNSYTGVTTVNAGRLTIAASAGKYGCGNPSGADNIAALSNYTEVMTTWRTDSNYVFRQYFSISAAVYPDGVTLTQLGIIGRAGTAINATWVALYGPNAAVLASVSIPAIPAASVVTGYQYFPVDLPITLQPGVQYSIVSKCSGTITPFQDHTNYTATIANGIIFNGGTYLDNASADALDYFPNQTANYNTGSANKLVWSSGSFKFNPNPYTIIVNGGGILDLSNVSASDTQYYVNRTKIYGGGQVIRKFLPGDIPQVNVYIDGTDTGTFCFSGTLNAGARTVRIVRDKIGKVGGASFYNNDAQIYNPISRNNRLESDGSNASNGKKLQQQKSLTTNFAYFYVASRMAGGTQRRIFDALAVNTLFGFHENGDYGVYWAGAPGEYVTTTTRDTSMRIGSVLRYANGRFESHTNNINHQITKTSTAQDIRMSINWGNSRSGEWSDNFYIARVIQAEGDLTQLEREAIEGFLAWEHAQTTQLQFAHSFKNVRPTVVQTTAGATIQQPRKWHYANVPTANRTASSRYSANEDVAYSSIGETIGGCWAPATAATTEWIKFDLGSIRNDIIGFAIQPRYNMDQGVATYTFYISSDNITFTKVSTNWTGNSNINAQRRSQIYMSTLASPLTARYIRIHPATWTSHPSMRGDVILAN